MKIEQAINIFVISNNGRKYKRVSHLSPDGSERVEWKRNSSNNTLNKSQSKVLEAQFMAVTGRFAEGSPLRREVAKLPVSKINEINNKIIPMIKSGHLLAGVKVVKEETNWGLKDAKEYVDTLRNDLKKRGVIS